MTDIYRSDDLSILRKQATGDIDEVTPDSLAHRVAEIERHLHHGERWFELAGTPTASHKAVRIGDSDGAGAFQIDGGDSSVTPTWGDWVEILGSGDTPIEAGMAYFDPGYVQIEDVQESVTYYVQIGFGASGAAALSAGQYTEIVYTADTTKFVGQIDAHSLRVPAGTQVWARCLCVGTNTGTMDFYIGIHEYEG